MKNTMILISGMPGVGKTTFAAWLSKELCAPLVCYDHIKGKILELMYASCKQHEHYSLFGSFPHEIFWFNCEEIMKSNSLFIAEHIFSNQMAETINTLTTKYQYDTITIHMDALVEVAYNRFAERNRNNPAIDGMRPSKISFDQFVAGTQQNKDFKHGSQRIYVDTTDFANVSYENIATQVKAIHVEKGVLPHDNQTI